MNPAATPRHVGIACGGTGGHVFPGLAVAGELLARGVAVTVFVSGKDVDRRAVAGLSGVRVVTLPAVGLAGGRLAAFARGFVAAWRAARREFAVRPPVAVLGLGGFTAAPVVLAASRARALRVLHEANAVPGRANRWLAPRCDLAAVYFPAACVRLRCARVEVVGMPVRPAFTPHDPAACRRELGLAPHAPTLLVTGGSQGARTLNQAALEALPALRAAVPGVQLIHLTGPEDEAAVRGACAAAGVPAFVAAFFGRMETALGAADLAVARAGASSLAELAAVGVPAILVPYPFAADDHQRRNAAEAAATGAVHVVEQRGLDGATFAAAAAGLLGDAAARERLRTGLRAWHTPGAAAAVAELVLRPCRGATAAAASSGPRLVATAA
ncbi:MAG: UDP-N-acetylglucosamine--N-acetylmuramyl-(pentapeptide) pyrophosphoryl-undecaprenol N-acetylglucosamine transferase [Limisphaerales bacterium]